MKSLILVTGGRGGSDFFQGLLDGHQEILLIPGVLRINKKFYEIFDSKDNLEIAKKFINFVPLIVNSKKNKLERHHKLGKNKNEFYIVDKKKFIFFFKNLSKNINYKKKDKIILIQNLFKAYYLASNRPISQAKLIILHTHTIDLTKKLFKFFELKDCAIIHTMRNPLNAISSPVYNWLNYKKGKFFFPKDLYFQLDLAVNGLRELCMMRRKTFVVLLENLISKKEIVMKDFCRIFNINYSKKMLNCTYFGKQWWGDSISNRWIGKKIKDNKKRQDTIENQIFYKKDLVFFNYLFRNLLIKYFDFKTLKNKDLNFFYKLLPLKSELMVWKNVILHKKIKHLLTIPFFYIKRILFLNYSFIINKKFNYPYSIGSK